MIEDLTPYRRDEPDWGFRQGTIVDFDVFAGTGTVRVGGATLTDVPFLSQAGQVAYLEGDAVLLVRFKSSWAIVGRYVTPGGQAAIGRYFEITGAWQGTPPTKNFAVTTSWTTRNSVAVPVPAWATVGTFTASFMARARNSTAADDFLWARVTVDGVAWGGTVSGTIPAGKFGSVTVTAHGQLLVPAGGTLTVAGQVGTGVANWSAHADNEAHVQVTIAFNSGTG